MSSTAATDELVLRTEQDIVVTRQAVRARAQKMGFSLVDQTKIVTAASELARNTLRHGLGGSVRIDTLEDAGRHGLRLEFVDQGPGIENMELAMTEGWTSGGGLGLGLSGAKRLSHEFAIESQPGKGTRVTITRWK